jgi:hypothetical protein
MRLNIKEHTQTIFEAQQIHVDERKKMNEA